MATPYFPDSGLRGIARHREAERMAMIRNRRIAGQRADSARQWELLARIANAPVKDGDK